MVVDANGKILARRARDEGEGVVMAEIELPTQPRPLEPIPERFWIPEQLSEASKESWERWLASGTHYYEAVTLPFLDTGEVNEYIPEYMM